jgi:O-antigen ligase
MIFGASLGWLLSQFNSIKNEVGLRWKIMLLCILSLLFFISLIIMQSRGSFGVAVLLGLSLLFLLDTNKVIKIAGVGVIVGILLLNVTLKTNIIQKQITNSKNNNVLAFRDRVWNVSLEASRFYPVFGTGLSNWHFINLDHLKKSVEARGELFDPENYAFPGHSHNLYLSALVERGIVGLIVTFFFMGAWIRNLIKTFDWARKSRETSYLWAGSFSAWFATFGVGLVNTTFHHEHGILACLFLGIYLSYTRLYQGKNKKYLSL